jgi:hypothetical protein
MKTFLLVIVAACFCMLSCKKSSPVTPGLFGKWELRSMMGGIAGFDSTYVAGNGTIYQFNSDSTYKHFIKHKLNDQGIFHIKSFFPPSSRAFEEIIFDNNTTGELFNYSGTQITIGEDVDDGIAMGYQKIQNQ